MIAVLVGLGLATPVITEAATKGKAAKKKDAKKAGPSKTAPKEDAKTDAPAKTDGTTKTAPAPAPAPAK
jgi:hypothetical protein